ncbi:hypothetical protein NMG60_11000731 [Bertholletia excelsa]
MENIEVMDEVPIQDDNELLVSVTRCEDIEAKSAILNDNQKAKATMMLKHNQNFDVVHTDFLISFSTSFELYRIRFTSFFHLDMQGKTAVTASPTVWSFLIQLQTRQD